MIDIELFDWPDFDISEFSTAFDIFEAFYKLIDKESLENFISTHCVGVFNKDAAISQEFLHFGNTEFECQNYDYAIYFYSRCMAFAPIGASTFTIALANRAASFFLKEWYKECLEDSIVLVSSNYSEKEKPKIFVNQAVCNIKLKQFRDAVVNLNSAKNKIQEVKESLDENELNDLFKEINEIDCKLSYYLSLDSSTLLPGFMNSDVDMLPPLKDGENPYFLGASRAVSFNISPRTGKGVFAEKDIEKGDVLFVEKPYILTPTGKHDTTYKFCANCGLNARNCIPCSTCALTYYCSEDCRNNHYEFSHKWMCFSDQNSLLPNIAKIAFDFLCRASLDEFKVHNIDEARYGNEKNNYTYVSLLLSKVDFTHYQFDYHLKTTALLMVYLKKYTNFFSWLEQQLSCFKGDWENMIRFAGGMILKYMCQNERNAVAVYIVKFNADSNNYLNFEFHQSAIALYVSSTLIQHSCYANISRSFYNGFQVLRATRPIRKGTRLFVNYLQNEQFLTKVTGPERRLHFLKVYGFICSCVYCEASRTNLCLPFLCNDCSGKVIPIKNSRKFGKCIHCFDVVDLETFWENHSEITTFLESDVAFKENELIKIFEFMKSIYHHENILFLKICDLFIKFYYGKGNPLKSWSYMIMKLNLLRVIFDETILEYVQMLLNFINLYHIRRMFLVDLSVLDNCLGKELTDVYSECEEILKLYLPPKSIKFIFNTLNSSSSIKTKT